MWRPVDRRENYVKRCTGGPGDTLSIVDAQVYINGVAQVNPPLLEHNYYVLTDGTAFTEESLVKMDITLGEVHRVVANNGMVYSMSRADAALARL